MKRLLILGVLVLLAGAGLLIWSQREARLDAERQLGLDASRVVAESFSKAAEVKVGTLRGRVLARGEDQGLLGVVRSEQVTAMPFSVDYTVDLEALGPGAYRWDAERKLLTVSIPDVEVGQPNIDETRASSQQKGVFISRRAARELATQTSRRADLQSREAARKPEHLSRARENARAVIARLAQGPLAAAGMADVRVEVSFPWESAGQPGEQIDRSRRMQDVVDER